MDNNNFPKECRITIEFSNHNNYKYLSWSTQRLLHYLLLHFLIFIEAWGAFSSFPLSQLLQLVLTMSRKMFTHLISYGKIILEKKGTS